MGDTVAVQGTSVKEIVRKGAQDYVNSHLWTALSVWPNTIADTIAGKGALAVGQVPNAAGGTIAGSAVGSAVATALKGSNGLGVLDGTKNEVLGAVSASVAKSCGLTTIATNYVAPGQPGAAWDRCAAGRRDRDQPRRRLDRQPLEPEPGHRGRQWRHRADARLQRPPHRDPGHRRRAGGALPGQRHAAR